MKALVLSGGSGSRLRPITHTFAKQLVPVANKPVLFYGLDAIRDAGITAVGIVVGETAAAIQGAVGDGQAFGLDVTYIRQEAALGLAHAVLIARDFLGDDDFVMYLGDNFIVGGITGLVDEFRSGRPDAQIMLTTVPDPRQFGVAELDEAGEVVGLAEKPRCPRSDLALVGVYIFTPAVHEAVRQPQPVGPRRTRDHRGPAVAARHRPQGTVHDHLGILEGHRQRRRHARGQPHGAGERRTAPARRGRRRDRAHRPRGDRARRRVSRSRIVGPAVIGAGTRMDGSYVGPFTSIAEGCTIIDSEIEYSIVLRGASVSGVRRIEASLIGHDVEVTPAPNVPRAHRLVLGDHSKVQISS